jgi:hypothetical protein
MTAPSSKWVSGWAAQREAARTLYLDVFQVEPILREAVCQGSFETRRNGASCSPEHWARSEWSFRDECLEVQRESFEAWLSNPSPKGKGGRKPYPWDEFWLEIVRIANAPDGLPARDELQERMIQWCHDTWGTIGDSTVRERIKLICDKLNIPPR